MYAKMTDKESHIVRFIKYCLQVNKAQDTIAGVHIQEKDNAKNATPRQFNDIDFELTLINSLSQL